MLGARRWRPERLVGGVSLWDLHLRKSGAFGRLSDWARVQPWLAGLARDPDTDLQEDRPLPEPAPLFLRPRRDVPPFGQLILCELHRPSPRLSARRHVSTRFMAQGSAKRGMEYVGGEGKGVT